MIDESVRSLMARIAKGLPVVVAAAAAPFVISACGTGTGCGNYDGQRETIVVTTTVSQSSDAGYSDGGPPGDAAPRADAGPLDCYTICDRAVGRPGNGKPVTQCEQVPGGTECTYEFLCLGGRRPEQAYSACGTEAAAPRDRWLMSLATAELASVPAFEELAEALLTHGAPDALVRRARESAQDEVRHARIAFALASREQRAASITIEAPRRAPSSLMEVAVHNAVEGCVREAYAALEAAWQSQHADDEETRQAFATIARDEARHAMLSLDIDNWVRSTLGADAAERLDVAKADALRSLEEELTERECPVGLGLPTGDAARSLAAMVA